MPERIRPRLFAFPRDVELAWLTELVPDNADRAVLEAMVDAFATTAKTKRLLPEHLDAIERAVGHPRPAVHGPAATRLTVLAHYFPTAAEALERAMARPESSIRVHVASALPNAPAEVAAPLLAATLSDSEYVVRKAAAAAANSLPLPELLPALQKAVANERDARVRVLLVQAVTFQEGAVALPAPLDRSGR